MRHPSWLRRLALGLPAAWLTACVVLAAVVHRTGTKDRGERSDVIVVLGASLGRDGTPNPALILRRAGFDVALSPVPASTIGPAFYGYSVIREVAALHRQVFR
jgi:hypothetical protein